MRDRDWYGQDRGRFGRDDDDNDDRWMSDEDRRWRNQSGGGYRGGQRYPEQSYGQRGYAGSGGYGQRESQDRGDFGGYGGGGYGAGGYGGEGYRGGGYGGGGQRDYGREQSLREANREWSPGRDVRRRDYPSSFGASGGGIGGGELGGGYAGGYGGGYGQYRRDEGRGYSTGFYGDRGDRGSERNYGMGYGGYGEERDRDDDRGLLERAGDWLQRKLGKAPKGYRRSDDRIREDVCDLIMRRGDIDASDVTVAVNDAEVTLSGTVRDRHTKRRLEDLAEDILGVKDVHNQVKVRREDETTYGSSTVSPNGDQNIAARTGATPATSTKSTRPSS